MTLARTTTPAAAWARTVAATLLLATVALAWAVLIGLGAGNARGADLSQLNAQLQSQQARQQSLSSGVASLSNSIATLQRQVDLVQAREASVRADLARDQATLERTRAALRAERHRLVLLRARLLQARQLLASQLISGYEHDRPDIIGVLLSAHGFTDLLEKLDFLHRAQLQQQGIIALTRAAKAGADLAARRLAALEVEQRTVTAGEAIRARALAGMNQLLQGKQDALARARAAQQSALAASRNRASQLRGQISQIRAAQAAAAAAAARRAAQAAAAAQAGSSGSSSSSGSTGSAATGPALGPSGGWAIPYSVVLCESGGQNLPPNSAGASGYYQILPSTWQGEGGHGPAAWLAPKSEQDRVAAALWNGGAGASNWVCAGIVGIH